MRARTTWWAAGCAAASAIAGCNSILGLDRLSIDDSGSNGAAGSSTSAGAGGSAGSGTGTGGGGSSNDAGLPDHATECRTNRECTERATAAAATRAIEAGADVGPGTDKVPAVCVQATGRCVELLSDDCKVITGDYLDDDAILLGSLFSTVGAQAATNLQRQQSATLAVEEINDPAIGGIPSFGGGKHKLLMLSCDEAANAIRAATHLIGDLHVPAIVGPNTSQDTLDLTNRLSAMGGTLMITPSAVASSIANLDDRDLTWLMAPTDEQRAPLMIQQINALESELRAARGAQWIKLGIVYRDDALGQGTQASLQSLILNGAPFTDPINFGKNIQVNKYDPAAPNQNAIVDAYRAFAPDIVVLAGTAEAVTRVLNPLEAQLVDAGGNRPYYVLIDSVKVPDLLTAAANPDLRARVRGTGITPGPESQPVFDAFKVAYAARYSTPAMPNQQPTASSTGPSYDAVYAIAYALAASKDMPVSGAAIASGLRKLASGATTITVGRLRALAAFQKLAAGEGISAIGTFAPLEWDANGAVVGGTLEMWCIGNPGNVPTFRSSGLTYNIKTKQFDGKFMQCP